MNLHSRCGALISVATLATFLGACFDESSPNSAKEEPLSSSSVGEVPFSSADSAIAVTQSSSSEDIPTSSSEIPISSSSSAPFAVQTGFQTWRGTDRTQRINTGYDAGTETSGYWYEVGDSTFGGSSSLIWGATDSEQCEGLCGKIILDIGTMDYNPFYRLVFDLAGKNAQGELVAVDATDMGGVCITYTSDLAPSLELSLGTLDSIYDYAIPEKSLPKTATPKTVNVKWSEFQQPAWARTKISSEEAVKNLASISFSIQAGTGRESKFNIIEVGSYGNCSYTPPPPPPIEQNPDSDPNPNLPKTSPFETWYGGDWIYAITTGYDVGTETSGHWFTYGGAYFVWPAQPDYNPNDLHWMDVIIDQCEGLCGTAHFYKGEMTEGVTFAGLGFNIAGEKDEFERGIASADVSAMGGVCVTYTSDNDMLLVLGLGRQKEVEYDYNLPTKTLPKSQTYITKYVPWADFKQPSEGNGKKISGEEAAKILTTIKFEIHGEDGTSADFSIKSVGPYNGGVCHP